MIGAVPISEPVSLRHRLGTGHRGPCGKGVDMHAIQSGQVRLIGVAGPSGSGKTRLAQALARSYPGGLVLNADDYYRDLSHLSQAEREGFNFDAPEALDLDVLAKDLIALRQGFGVDAPVYDFASHTRRPRTRRIEPAGLIVTEGVLLLHSAAVRAQFDLSVYLDAPLDICLLRRLRRDTLERGRSAASVLAQYEATVRPMALTYVLPQRGLADRVLSGEGPLADLAATIVTELFLAPSV
jgi:uridine kinase